MVEENGADAPIRWRFFVWFCSGATAVISGLFVAVGTLYLKVNTIEANRYTVHAAKQDHQIIESMLFDHMQTDGHAPIVREIAHIQEKIRDLEKKVYQK